MQAPTRTLPEITILAQSICSHGVEQASTSGITHSPMALQCSRAKAATSQGARSLVLARKCCPSYCTTISIHQLSKMQVSLSLTSRCQIFARPQRCHVQFLEVRAQLSSEGSLRVFKLELSLLLFFCPSWHGLLLYVNDHAAWGFTFCPLG